MVALQRDYESAVRGAIDAGADAIVSGAGLPLALPAIQPPRRHGPHPHRLVGPRARAHLPPLGATQLPSGRRRPRGAARRRPPRVPRRPGRPRGEHPRAAPAAGQGGRARPRRLPGHRRRRHLHARGHPPLPRARRRRRADGHALPGHRGEQRHSSLQAGRAAGAAQRTSSWPTTRARPAACPSACCASRRCTSRRSPAGERRGATRATCSARTRRDATRVCPAKEDNEHSFCICNGLCSAAGYDADREEPLYTAGTTAARVDRILPVETLMAELAGLPLRVPLAV